jgi:hypothetical protein
MTLAAEYFRPRKVTTKIESAGRLALEDGCLRGWAPNKKPSRWEREGGESPMIVDYARTTLPA